VTPDGDGLYFLGPIEELAPREINIVIGWRSLLNRP